MKIIIFDFEVFRYDTLLGVKIIDDNDIKLLQIWDLDEIRQFYKEHIDDIWIGHNNCHYDNLILQAIINFDDPYKMSKLIINSQIKKKLTIKLNYYDLITNHLGSLKAVECSYGKKISETKIDFDLDRNLTNNEKYLTEIYNQADLEQTFDDFIAVQSEIQLRLDVITEFNLPLSCLHVTGTQLAEIVLDAKYVDNIENWIVKPKLYPNLRLKNEEVKNFYLTEQFKLRKNLEVTLCGVSHKLGSGGIHGARKNYHTDWAYYFDVSGYYNLIMLLLDLLPRSISEKGKELYKKMYYDQIELKKQKLYQKRAVYKVILLSVFGAMTNEYCKFYDPYHGQLVTITGQIFLVDLLEKLDGYIELIQSNTDGIIAKPLPNVTEQQLINIINEWQNRTGFVLKLEKITDIHQRDVNCYMYKDDNDYIHCLGEALKYYHGWDNPFVYNAFNAKEPVIFSKCIVNYFINGILPEQTIDENKDNLIQFQYICKKGTFDWLEFEAIDCDKNVSIDAIQNVNRAFSLNSSYGSGMIYKRKSNSNTKTKYQNLPENVFIYNDDIRTDYAKDAICKKIDWQYYIDRAYERIEEFLNIDKIKDVVL